MHRFFYIIIFIVIWGGGGGCVAWKEGWLEEMTPLFTKRNTLRHWIQNTQEIKENVFFSSTKQDKTSKFSRKSSFSSYVQHKTEKKNN